VDVLTIRERARRLRAQGGVAPEGPKQSDPMTAAERQIRHLDALKRRNSIPEAESPPPSLPKNEVSHKSKATATRRRSRSHQIKQKNIQLRLDQIKGLREYAYRSGSINGSQLNESQICRVAIDILFWLNVNPTQIDDEVLLLEAVKKKIESLFAR